MPRLARESLNLSCQFGLERGEKKPVRLGDRRRGGDRRIVPRGIARRGSHVHRGPDGTPGVRRRLARLGQEADPPVPSGGHGEPRDPYHGVLGYDVIVDQIAQVGIALPVQEAPSVRQDDMPIGRFDKRRGAQNGQTIRVCMHSYKSKGRGRSGLLLLSPPTSSGRRPRTAAS